MDVSTDMKVLHFVVKYDIHYLTLSVFFIHEPLVVRRQLI